MLAEELTAFDAAFKELDAVGPAQRALAAALANRLRAPALALTAERVFHTDETPTIKLTVRNVKTVKLRLWSIDVRDYFEKMAQTKGLEELDVALIAPDRTWEHEVGDYKRYKEIAVELPLTATEPGAYIVTARAGDLEARTLALVSDLALIVRAGRRGAAVQVQNRRTGELVKDAVVRLAADGRHLKTWTKETTPRKLTILAEAADQLAFQTVDLTVLSPSPLPAAQAVVATDRQRYGPGDTVEVHVVVRTPRVQGASDEPAAGARDAASATIFGDVAAPLVIPSTERYRLVATSANGVRFLDEPLELSAHGLATQSLDLPSALRGHIHVDVVHEAPTGEARLARCP